MALVATSGFVEAARMLEVSLEVGNACRERVPWSLRVGDLTPQQLLEHLWPRCSSVAVVAALGRDPLGLTRLKRRRLIERVRVEVDRAIDGASWPPSMKELQFGPAFNRPLERVVLPDGVRVLSFGVRFNQPVSKVRWPATLKELSFGNDFNQPVSGINLPTGLRRLDLGGRFNFAIFAVDWPENLRELRFGHGFNREIASVRWPPKLEKLEFCGEFQQRIEDVAWPRGLEHLALLGDFNQPLDAVDWPPVLRSVRFGDGFRQPLVRVRWPPRLERVVLGRDFDRPLNECVWPLGLKEITVPLGSLLESGGTGRGKFDGVPVPVVALTSSASGDVRPKIPEACAIKVLFNDEHILLEDNGEDIAPDSLRSGLEKALKNEGVAWAGGHLCIRTDGEEEDGDADYRCDENFEESDWGNEGDARLAAGGCLECSGCLDVFGYEADAWEVDGAWDLRGHFVS